MKFAGERHWWTRAAQGGRHSLEGRWLPLLPLGGILVVLVLAAWRFESHEKLAAKVPAPLERGADDVHQLPAVHIRLEADAAGHLASISLNGRPVRDLAQLRDGIKAFLGPSADATMEAELDCDGNLRYEDTRQTIAAISSYPSGDGRTSMPMVDRVKFLPRRATR